VSQAIQRTPPDPMLHDVGQERTAHGLGARAA
jgi:hypothetical protein